MSRRPAPSNAPFPTPPDGTVVTGDLLSWYDRHRRVLPWRALPGQAADPYGVWLSEIMLQQTTVQAVKPFYAKFLAAWPDVAALAAASLDDVLRAWAGLGYYSRARSLHACARVVATRHDGVFPHTEAALRALPGVGAYTAAAVAAIGFGEPATVVDGNVERVMTRLHAIEVALPRARALVYEQMRVATPKSRPGDFAQAVMDLGATICTPRSPACVICPLASCCAARRSGEPTRYPIRAKKPDRHTRYGTAYYIRDASGRVQVRTRPPTGLLGGMTELPGTAWRTEKAPEPARPGDRLTGQLTHVFTHFTLVLDVVMRPYDGQMFKDVRWVAESDLQAEALPTLMRNAIAIAQK